MIKEGQQGWGHWSYGSLKSRERITQHWPSVESPERLGRDIDRYLYHNYRSISLTLPLSVKITCKSKGLTITRTKFKNEIDLP